MDAEAIALAIREDLDELAELSAPGPGVTRLAFGPEDARAREWFKARCERIGLSFRVDRAGNCVGVMPAAEGRRPLLLGSHLDSVPGGGRYDGALGVVVALRLAERLRDVPLAAASFACEESSRFGFGSIGSRYLVGDLRPDDFGEVVDTDGQPLPAVLADARLDALGPATPIHVDDFRGYLEVHIDQGTMLTSAGRTLGVVSHIAGVQRTRVTWTGEEAHSGGRLRSERRDALLAAAEFVVRANEEWVAAHPDEQTLALTVGRLTVEPNRPNTVPGRAELILEIRAADAAATDAMLARLEEVMADVARARGVEVETEQLGRSEPLSMHEVPRRSLEAAAAAVGVTAPPCVSLAGHDALTLGRFLPTGMLLLANPSGLSHAPAEAVDDRAIVDCVAVLAEAVPRLATALEER